MRILIVEDELYAREALAKMIRLYDQRFEVFEAEDGDKAKRLAEKTAFDLIITDIRMPVCDGLAFAGWLRERDDHAEIVLLSGYEAFDYAVEAMRLGIREYLLKPIEEGRLYEILDRLSGGGRGTGDRIVDTVDSYIYSQHGGPVNIADMCRTLLFMNPAYVSRRYRAVTGHTISWAVTDARLAKAAAMLEDGDMEVAEIGLQCGYQSLSAFIQSFSKKYGVTPAAYRSGPPAKAPQERGESGARALRPAARANDGGLLPRVAMVTVSERKNVHIRTVAGALSWQISSEEDVDAYLAELKANLVGMLREGTVLDVEF